MDDQIRTVQSKTLLAPANTQLFSCPNCNAAYRSRSGMTRHYCRVHESHLEYHCTLCTKKFARKHILNQHIKDSHQYSRPCRFCFKSFRFNYQRTAHENVSHASFITWIGNHKVKCPLCKKSFKNLAFYAKHALSHHGEPSLFLSMQK
jgi:uncharacterized C2H2 Zn-finger protein